MNIYQPTLSLEISEYLSRAGLTATALEKIAGIPTGYLAKMIRGDKMCGELNYNRLVGYIQFSDEARAEAVKHWRPYGPPRTRVSSYDPQPWPITVRNLRLKRPAYNFPVPA